MATSTQYIWSSAHYEPSEVIFNDLTALIYNQLLELYIRDLEIENTGLQLQVAALQITVGKYPVQPVNPYPYSPYPWNPNTVWCSTETQTVS
jgi:hypothetical protein